jgi:hypothetical protein
VNLDNEQLEVIEVINTMLDDEHSGYGWGNFQGDVVPRILIHYIKRHLPGSRKIVGPNVFIEDVPTEFDLMIVDAESNPITFTLAYPSEHVRCVIEVKRRGIIGDIDKFKRQVKKTKNNFDNALYMWRWDKEGLHRIKERRVDCRAAYIAISERVSPKRESSHNYGKITREILDPYPAFILQDSGSKEIQVGEWQRFIEFITSDQGPTS